MLRAAVAQAAAAGFDAPASVENAGAWMGRAAAEGAQLVVFPEAFVGGYPKGSAFGATVGAREPSGYEEFARYAAGAIAVPGPEVEALGAHAAAHALHVVIGVIERDRGTLYCTVLFFDAEGRLLGRHRKLMPTAAERLIWGFGDGSTMPVFDTPFGRLGAVVCWENYMPLLRMAMYGKGIEIYCAPTADGRERWVATMRHVALEGRCFVLSANQFTTATDYPPEHRAHLRGDGPVATGRSCIVNPFGEVIAGPAEDGETLLVADLDLALITQARFEFDPVGHYARPDVFQLLVDERARPPVTVVGAEASPRG